ncbi:MAG: OmpA family protein [Bacteroidetes bacterium]|jgi:chemotaxis protein MotB|nr:OmpA family protein [Bacteroidota bacterium]
MRTLLTLCLLSCLAAALHSGCVPKKKYVALLAARDSLQLAHSLKAQQLAETLDARDSLQQLKERLADALLETTQARDRLQASYDELSATNLDQAERFGKALELKTAELKHQEALLAEREARLSLLEARIAAQQKQQNRLLETLRKALDGYQASQLSLELKDGQVYLSLSDKLLFGSGSAELGQEGKAALKQVAEVLRADTSLHIRVEGHTDTDPIRTSCLADNWDLSVVRATAVVRLLSTGYAIDPRRLTAAGKGAHQPIAPNESRAQKALNRRTELIIAPQLAGLYELLK